MYHVQMINQLLHLALLH